MARAGKVRGLSHAGQDIGFRLELAVVTPASTGRYLLPPLIPFALACCIMVGEVASGTDVYFATMAALAVFCAAVTYNLLGGLGTMSGIAFAALALRTFVISQFAKVILFQPADQYLRVPLLTITVYAVFFFSLMLGAYLYAWIRLPLPGPKEEFTSGQVSILYFIALVGGAIGEYLVMAENLAGVEGQHSAKHSAGLALSMLLPFSLVLAIDSRIRKTQGRHSFGWAALAPALIMAAAGFVGAVRTEFLMPLVATLVTGYLRGYRFRMRHYVAVLAFTILFFLFASPFVLYSRSFRGEVSLSRQASVMMQALETAPEHWQSIQDTIRSSSEGSTRGDSYFPDSVVLNRFALIGADSTLISACSEGFHYQFTALRLDVLSAIPRFLYKNKPDSGADGYLGQLDGQEVGFEETTFSTVTAISDSYGAFGWLGSVLYPLLLIPAILVVYESMFDMSRPWGTAAAVTLILGLTEGTMGQKIMGLLIREPLTILIVSRCVALILKMLPTGRDTVRTAKAHRDYVLDKGAAAEASF